jgi:hypothetical protein
VKRRPPVICVSSEGRGNVIGRTGADGGGGGTDHEECLDCGVAVEGRHCDS